MAGISKDQIAEFRKSTPSVMNVRLQELEVTQYFGVIFSDRAIPTMTKQDMTGFLSYRQNKRWREISKEDVTANMPRLRDAIACLVDESQSISARLNMLEPGRGELAVPHLGKAKLTPILLVTYPKLYGVWNDYSERALRGMGIFPEFAADWHLGEQFEVVNAILDQLANEYNVSLWWLDIILERIARLVR